MADALDEKAFRPVRQLLGLDELLVRGHRRGPDPGRGAAAGSAPSGCRHVGDLRHEREHRPGLLGPVRGAAGHRRPGHPRPRAEARSTTASSATAGGNVFRRLPRRPGAHRRGPRRRGLGALRRHRPPSTTTATCASSTARRSSSSPRAGRTSRPANLEAALKAFPLIGQAAVIGDDRPYVAALLVLDPEVAPGLGAQPGHRGADLAALAQDPTVLRRGRARTSARRWRAFNQAERVKRWTLLPAEWLPDSEELTPTMKLKRRGWPRSTPRRSRRCTPEVAA